MKTKTIELKIKGMTCPSCSAVVEKLTAELPGIESKTINHATDSGIFEFDETVISEQEIIAKINEGHYKVDGREQIVIKTKTDAPPCPACGKTGQKVFNSVFKSNVKPESFSKIDLNGSNYICFNSDCEIAYYDEADLRINQSELKRPLWFKKAAKKKIICYCNNIDKSQIRTAISEYQLITWEEITSHYRKKVIEKCEILNPTGYCCRNTFAKVVGKLSKDIAANS